MAGLYHLFALLVVATFLGAGDAKPPQRIVGGSIAAAGEFPYQVSLKLRGQQLCGGAIIGKRHILTAAHCVAGVVKSPYNELRVVSGTIAQVGGQSHAVKSVTVHEKWDDKSANVVFDIAVIELKADIAFDKNQDKIELPSSEPTSGSIAVASGWGFENMVQRRPSTRLMKVSLKVIDYELCQKYMRFAKLTKDHVCTHEAPGRGVCSGDSGGPLVAGGKLIGIVSYGLPCAQGYPDVFTNVYQFRSWIDKVVEKSS